MEIANFFWEGKLTILEKACIKSFIDNGFNVKLWSYNNLEFEGAETCNAAEVLSYDTLYSLCSHDDANGKTKTQSSLAAISDVLRIALINHVGGGWWFDTDCFCLRPVEDFTKLRNGAKLCAGIQYNSFVTNGALYMDTEYSKKYLDDLIKFVYLMRNKRKEWGVFGPKFLQTFIKNNNSKTAILPKEFFYGIGWDEFDYFVDPKLYNKAKEKIKNSYLSHIFTTSFNTRKLNKNEYCPEGSLLDEFYKVLD